MTRTMPSLMMVIPTPPGSCDANLVCTRSASLLRACACVRVRVSWLLCRVRLGPSVGTQLWRVSSFGNSSPQPT